MIKLKKERVLVGIQLFLLLIFIFSIILAVNLRKNFREARNSVRRKHFETIATAVYSYYIIYNKFPDCIPLELDKAVEVKNCPEITQFLTFPPKDPLPNHKYLIKYSNEERNSIKIFSTAPEAKGVELVR